jgi:hypothetical protein
MNFAAEALNQVFWDVTPLGMVFGLLEPEEGGTTFLLNASNYLQIDTKTSQLMLFWEIGVIALCSESCAERRHRTL